MENNKFQKANFIEILFAGRHKEYGAYELRTSYSKRMTKAVIGMLVILFVLIAGSAISSSLKSKAVDIELADVVLEKVKKRRCTTPTPTSSTPSTFRTTEIRY